MTNIEKRLENKNEHIAYSSEVNLIRPILAKYMNEWSANMLGELAQVITESKQQAVAEERERAYEENEIVICSAVKTLNGEIIRGHRHHNAMATMRDIPRFTNEAPPYGDRQGFVTSLNRYVTRSEACKIQKKAGIESIMPDGQKFLGAELYSEDLY